MYREKKQQQQNLILYLAQNLKEIDQLKNSHDI